MPALAGKQKRIAGLGKAVEVKLDLAQGEVLEGQSNMVAGFVLGQAALQGFEGKIRPAVTGDQQRDDKEILSCYRPSDIIVVQRHYG